MVDLKALKRAYVAAKKEYYGNGNTSLTDAEFDRLEARIRKLEPEWPGLQKTGVSVGKKTEVKLDKPMPSLDKIQADRPEVLAKFLGKHPEVVIMPKYDGSSVQLVYENGDLTKLRTRGDGVLGKDISYFIPHISVPKRVPAWKSKTVVLRAEAIFTKADYQKKYSGQYDSDRALASAILNRQDVARPLKDLHFVCLRVLSSALGLRSQLADLKVKGFRTARYAVVKAKNLDADILSTLVEQARSDVGYTVDGLVLSSNAPGLSVTADRPPYAKAFKLNDEESAVETVVENIVWKASSFGVLVPKAIVRPIKFGNVTVKQAAVHNAKWAMDRGVGIGAKVKILRSGDIIPKIVAVTRKAEFKLPSKSEFGSWEWDDTKTSIRLTTASKGESRVVGIARISRFFAKLDLESFGGAMAEKLYDAGYTKTSQLPGLTAKEFAELPGVKGSAVKFAKEIRKIQSGHFPVTQLMVASGVFERGLGDTLLEKLYDKHPRLFQATATAERIEKYGVPCIGPVATRKFLKDHAAFFRWMARSGAVAGTPTKVQVTKGPLSGVTGTWTGYRDKEQEALFVSLGGKVDSLKSSTTVLFYRQDGKPSGKVESARAKGIKVSQFETFVKKYL